MKPLRECKIECENWWQNRRLQLYLSENYGVRWGTSVKAPFNTRRRGRYLMIQKGVNGWYFAWATERDFHERCQLPATTAKTLYEELTK